MRVNRYLKLPFREPIELYRCDTCGELVIEKPESLMYHGGHYLKQPVSISIIEYLMLLFGIIR